MTPERLRAKLAKLAARGQLSDLARVSGVTVRTLRRLVNEGRSPRAGTMEKLLPWLK